MHRNIIEYLQSSARRFPDKTALAEPERRMTFRELEEYSKRLATQISKILGKQINQPIAVCMKKSINCIAAFSGISYSGNIYSPIDISSPMERIFNILDVFQPKCMIADKQSYDFALRISGAIPVIVLEDITEETDERLLAGIAEKRLDIDPVYTLFTSGSTGKPKGVVISQAGVIDYTEWLASTFGFDENTIFGEQAPFYFDNSVLDIYSTLRNGASLVIIPEDYFMFPTKLFDYLNEEKINTIFWVPSALVGAANSGILEKQRSEYLEKILFCGEVMPTKQFNQWRKEYPDALFANLYGPTEITDVCAYYIVDRPFRDDEPLPLGKACENMEILVLNESDEPVGVDETGELCVRGTGLSMGYYTDKEKTEKAFVQNPLNSRYNDLIYRTGDLAKYNERGELVYVGRKDFQIKHQGHRIELGEIESAANSLDELNSCCAVYDNEHKVIVLFCTGKPEMTAKAVYKHIKNYLPNYMMPGKIILKDSLPLNINGKIDRLALLNEAKAV